MPIKGKLIGLLLGFWLFHLPGALLGLWIGHLYDQGLQRRMRHSRRQTSKGAAQAAFIHVTFAVMGHIAKAGGRVTEQQIRVAILFMDRMQLSPAARREAQEAFRQGKEPGFALTETLRAFRQGCGGDQDLLRIFLEIQLQAAFANGQLVREQRALLLEVAELLGFSRWELEQFLAMAQAEFNFASRQHGDRSHQQHGHAHGQRQAEPPRDRLRDAYALLGVAASVPDGEVKRAYRKLMSKHHPDKLAARGLPPEMLNMAKEKAQEIQQAWEMVKQARGIR